MAIKCRYADIQKHNDILMFLYPGMTLKWWDILHYVIQSVSGCGTLIKEKYYNIALAVV